VGAVQTALEFSVKESAVRAAATIAERFILDGDFQSAEELVAMFGISSNLEEFSKAHVETLISEKQHMAATRFAKHLALKEMARKAIMAQIETEDSPPSKNILAAAREFGASEDEIFSAIEKSLEGILAKGDSPSGFLYFLEDLGDSPLPKENARRIAMVCIRKLAEREDYVEALVTARKYGIPKGDVRGIAIQAIASGMGAEEEEVAKISEDFGVGKEELATIAEEAMLNRIREGRYDYATKIALAYPVSEANANFLKGVLSALPK
jgi:transcriptional regulator with XRE-family HTH domain